MGKVLGGTSTINTLLYARGFKQDYDLWEELGNYGWNWENVLSYFKKSEDNLDSLYAQDEEHHSKGGYLGIQTFPYHDQNTYTVVKAYEELGYKNTDYNGAHPTGIFMMQGTIRDGMRESAYNSFLKPIRYRKNLDIVTGIRITNLIINHYKVVRGIEYVLENDHSNTGKVFANKEVILSAGTFGSPQILMLSGIGPKHTLQKLGIPVVRDAKVGYNLQNHPTSVGVTVKVTNSSTLPRSNQEWLGHIKEYMVNKTGPLSATGISQMSGYNPSSGETEDYPDIKFGFSFSDVNTQNAFLPGSYYDRITIDPYYMRSRSRGVFTINSTDPFSHPLIYPNLVSDPRYRLPLVEGHLLALKIAQTESFKKAGYEIDTNQLEGCEYEIFGTKEYFECVVGRYVGSAHHYTGTCKMGPSYDLDAVVSPRLKVYGVHSLRVIDASIIPEIPSANTNAAAIMIGEKGSDIIKQDHLIEGE